jgi:DNA topoisomerase-1
MTTAVRSGAAGRGLLYVDDGEPGLQRIRRGRGFEYRDPSRGARISDADTLTRIRGLAIPPAWVDVWICTDPRGHLQATGRDAKGRKQYRYHPDWRALRDRHKFEKLADFGLVLPRVRHQVADDLELPGLPRARVLATVVRLLELTSVRIGNDEYARTNGSYGLTTLRANHLRTTNSEVRFVFPGKSGIRHCVDAHDRRVVRVLRRCQELPGQRLFQYVDDDGTAQAVHSHDVNDYLRDAAGVDATGVATACDLTAKDFRTWTGTASAAAALAQVGPPVSTTECRHVVADVLADVAAELGNTPAVCRASYVHPAVIEGFERGVLQDAWQRTPRSPAGLDRDERRLLGFLRASTRPRRRRAQRAS